MKVCRKPWDIWLVAWANMKWKDGIWILFLNELQNGC